MPAASCDPLSGPIHDNVARFAYQIYEEEGRPEGQSLEHWLWAEAMLINSDGDRTNGKPRMLQSEPRNVNERPATNGRKLARTATADEGSDGSRKSRKRG